MVNSAGESSVVRMKGDAAGDETGLTGEGANDAADAEEIGVYMPEIAIKIFKTSILVFKDRDRYVTGDHRFKGGYSKHNPRKMVKVCGLRNDDFLLKNDDFLLKNDDFGQGLGGKGVSEFEPVRFCT